MIPHIIAGPCHLDNKGALDWAEHGLIAYGCSSYVVVVERHPFRKVQTLEGHTAIVTHLKWSTIPSARASAPTVMMLASGDFSGTIIVWDVHMGAPICVIKGPDNSTRRSVLQILWHPYNKQNIIVVYSGSLICIWDTTTGNMMTRLECPEPLTGVHIDPFNVDTALLSSDTGWTFFLKDLHNEPSIDVTTRVKITSSRGLASGAVAVYHHVAYSLHRSSCVLFVLPREVLLFDVVAMQALCSIVLREEPDFVLALPSPTSPHTIYCVHADSSISWWTLDRHEGKFDLGGWMRAQGLLVPVPRDRGVRECLLRMVVADPRVGSTEMLGITDTGMLLVFSTALPHSDASLVKGPAVGCPRLVQLLESLPGPCTCLAASSFDTTSQAPIPLVCACVGRCVYIVRPGSAASTILRQFILPQSLCSTVCVKWIDPVTVLVVGAESTTKTQAQTPSLAGATQHYHSTVAFVNIRSGEVDEWKSIGATGPAVVIACLPSPSGRWLLVIRRKQNHHCDVELWCLQTRKHIHTSIGNPPHSAACWLPPTFAPMRSVGGSVDSGTDDGSASPAHPVTQEAEPADSLHEQFLCVSGDGIVQRFVVHSDGTVIDANDRFRPNVPLSGVRCIGTCGKFVGIGDKEGTLVFVDIMSISKRVIDSFQSGRGAVHAIHFCPGANHMAMVCFVGKNVGIWDLQRSRCVALKAIAVFPESVFWMPSGNAVCASFRDGSLRVMGRGLDPPRPILSYALNPSTPSLLGTMEAVLLKLHATFPAAVLAQAQEQIWRQSQPEFCSLTKDSVLGAVNDAFSRVEQAIGDSTEQHVLWSTLSNTASQLSHPQILETIANNFDAMMKDCNRSLTSLQAMCASMPRGNSVGHTCLEVARFYGDTEEVRFWSVALDTCSRFSIHNASGSESDFAADPFDVEESIADLVLRTMDTLMTSTVPTSSIPTLAHSSSSSSLRTTSAATGIPAVSIPDPDIFPPEQDDDLVPSSSQVTVTSSASTSSNTAAPVDPFTPQLVQATGSSEPADHPSLLFSDRMETWFGGASPQHASPSNTSANTPVVSPSRTARSIINDDVLSGSQAYSAHTAVSTTSEHSKHQHEKRPVEGEDFMAIDLLDVGDDVPSPVLALKGSPKRVFSTQPITSGFDDILHADIEETAIALHSLRQAASRPQNSNIDFSPSHTLATHTSTSAPSTNNPRDNKNIVNQNALGSNNNNDDNNNDDNTTTTTTDKPDNQNISAPLSSPHQQQHQHHTSPQPPLVTSPQKSIEGQPHDQSPPPPHPQSPQQQQPQQQPPPQQQVSDDSDTDDTAGVIVGLCDDVSDTDKDPEGISFVSPHRRAKEEVERHGDFETGFVEGGDGEVRENGLLRGADAILGRNEEWKRTEQHVTNIRSQVTLGYHRKQRLVADQIRLGLLEGAIDQLTATPADHARNEVDVLRACVLAAAVSPQHFRQTASSVALRFLANGKSEIGVELLCAVGEAKQACEHLISAGLWPDALRVAKAHLHGTAYVSVMKRWAYHLHALGKDMDSLLVLLSVGCFGRVVHQLITMGMPDMAACFLFHLKSSFSANELEVPSHMLDAVCLAYGRVLLLASHLQAACAVLNWSRDVHHFRVLASHLLAPSRQHIAHKPVSHKPQRVNPTMSASSLRSDGSATTPTTTVSLPTPLGPSSSPALVSSTLPSLVVPTLTPPASPYEPFHLKHQLGRVKSQTSNVVSQAIGSKLLQAGLRPFRPQKDSSKSQAEKSRDSSRAQS